LSYRLFIIESEEKIHIGDINETMHKM